MSKRPNEHRCEGALACGEIVNERNHWFTGKFVTARAYRTEQRHFLSHRWLHNRMLHGWGVVDGLRVIPHPDPECADRWVVVRCGLAIDCCGRELFLPLDSPLELPLPEPEDSGEPEDQDSVDEDASEENEQEDDDEPTGEEEEEDYETEEGDEGDEGDEDGEQPAEEGPEPWLVCLRYGEQELEWVPALQSEGSCDPKRSEPNLVRQIATLDVVPISAVEPDCWRLPGGGEAGCRDDCDDDIPTAEGACLEPVCPCGSCVPLALILPKDPDAGWEGGYEIDLDGRRTLPTPADRLTHIAKINWPHGGRLHLSQLRDDLGGRLKVRFDRKIRPATDHSTGINEHTFIVQYGGIQQGLEFLSSRDERGPYLKDDCTAVFKIDKRDLTGNRTIAGHVLHITLRCDFILDCHGTPVDGEHLGGRLPSGDGVPGGTFVSWVRVVDD